MSKVQTKIVWSGLGESPSHDALSLSVRAKDLTPFPRMEDRLQTVKHPANLLKAMRRMIQKANVRRGDYSIRISDTILPLIAGRFGLVRG